MNIQDAKEQIKRAITIYLMKDEYGGYRIPLQRQRPVFLLGAPGIGKTAVMEQIAQEMDIALVSYSMTHHTRQSALGLPFIEHKNYGGKEFDISEYTMSEIIASVYETMEESGKSEGILFLDEINCVSETLAPSMLQFLQYKTFGRHRVPDGWVIVTAGNPPQFNRLVREFDIVTMDRMKVMEIDADYEAWRKYGVNKGLHGSIITYLDIKKSDFYVIENTAEGKSYVTARGWEDLSDTIYLYEENDFPVDEVLIGQYLKNRRISREFASYYELYKKYRQDYKVSQILAGTEDENIRRRAREAGFDERVSLVGLLTDFVQGSIKQCVETEDSMKQLLASLKTIKEGLALPETASADVSAGGGDAGVQADSRADERAGFAGLIFRLLDEEADRITAQMQRDRAANSLDERKAAMGRFTAASLHEYKKLLSLEGIRSDAEAFEFIKRKFDRDVEGMRFNCVQTGKQLSNLFNFVEKMFGTGNEMLILVTDLTVNADSAAFISRKGCKEYFKYSKKFQLYERQQEIAEAFESLELI